MEGKKAQNITVSTIIIIVLALVVLVVLVIGFTSGWGNLWETITGIFPSSSNIEKVVKSCQVACTTNSAYDYCSLKRTIRWQLDEKTVATTTAGTCDKLENKMEVLTNKGNKNLPTTTLTCDIECPAEETPLECTQLKGKDDKQGEWKTVDKGKECPIGYDDKTSDYVTEAATKTSDLNEPAKEVRCCVPA